MATAPVFRNRSSQGQLAALNGVPVTPMLGVITAATAVSNSSTAVPFTMVPGQLYALQPDSACYIGTGATSAAAIAAANSSSATAGGFKLDNTFAVTYYLALPGTDAFLAVFPVSGTSNVKVFVQE